MYRGDGLYLLCEVACLATYVVPVVLYISRRTLAEGFKSVSPEGDVIPRESLELQACGGRSDSENECEGRVLIRDQRLAGGARDIVSESQIFM